MARQVHSVSVCVCVAGRSSPVADYYVRVMVSGCTTAWEAQVLTSTVALQVLFFEAMQLKGFYVPWSDPHQLTPLSYEPR